jgi:tetratricopeptide (TPR) repeat protein
MILGLRSKIDSMCVPPEVILPAVRLSERILDLNIGQTYLAMNENDKARNIFVRLFHESTEWDRSFAYSLASVLLEVGELKMAGSLSERLIREYPNSPEGFFVRGLVKAELGISTAMSDVECALLKDPLDLQVLLRKALFELSEEDFLRAQVSARRVVELSPDEPVGYVLRGLIRCEAGDHAGAVSDFETAGELDSSKPLIHFGRAYVEAQLGNKRKSIKHLEAGAELSAEDDEMYRYFSGVTKYLLELEDRGVGDLRRLTCTRDRFPPPHYYLGLALYAQGQKEEGMDHWRKARELGERRAFVDLKSVHEQYKKRKSALRTRHGHKRLSKREKEALYNKYVSFYEEKRLEFDKRLGTGYGADKAALEETARQILKDEKVGVSLRNLKEAFTRRLERKPMRRGEE